MFKPRFKVSFSYLLLAPLTLAIFAFPLRTYSQREIQNPITSQQIEALPRRYSVSSADDRIALYQALLDLQTPWTVMCVAAHPDDEDGTSLVVMRRKYGAHTVSLFSTFGEGGQNAIGPELYEEMGAIRLRETLAASEIQGSEPHFLGLKDFGFSKSPDETFKEWGHDEALRRMVLQIRKLRPDVIITNHSVTSNDHGHHQATARLVVEAFDAAADPAKFPEQLKQGVSTWQVQRLFVRARRNDQTDNAQIVTIDPNEQDPVRGVSFAEEALSALQQHATQGPWPKSVAQMAARFTNSTDGKLPVIRYRLAREAKATPPLPKEARNFLDGLSLPNSFSSDADVPSIEGKPLLAFIDDRARVAEALIQRARKEYRLPSPGSDFNRLALIKDRIDRATALALGVSVQATASSDFVTPNSTTDVTIKVTNSGSHSLYGIDCGSKIPTPQRKESNGGGPTSILTTRTELKAGGVFTKQVAVRIPAETSFNVPLARYLYEPGAIGTQLVTTCSMSVAAGLGNGFNVTSQVPLNVGPPLEIADISPTPLVINRPGVGVSSAGADILPATPPKVTVKLVNHLKRPFKGDVAFGFENRSPETRMRVDLLPQQTKTLAVMVPNTEENRAAHLRRPDLANSLWFSLRSAGAHDNLTKLSVPVVWVDARVDRKATVGYVRGFDFSLPNALDALEVKSKELSVDEVKTADLSEFSSLIVDNRVYESQPDLISANQKLLDYAKNGGNLIVFYHKTNEWNPDTRRNRPQLAPYKLIVSDDRVTDENAPITFLEPQHPLLNVPNKIGPDDFVGWIQERGVYYPKEWDAQFQALLQSNDPGEAPLKGGLLVADYGRGHYIYTSMVWYRQLRAGVPGAYRMLANMISYGQEKK
jgi:LmbE family N-acetylglucosaminyl deacetylase